MGKSVLKRILKWFLLGIVVAVGGMIVSELLADFLFTGMAWGDGINLSMEVYLCIVIVTCTGVIVSHMDNK